MYIYTMKPQTVAQLDQFVNAYIEIYDHTIKQTIDVTYNVVDNGNSFSVYIGWPSPVFMAYIGDPEIAPEPEAEEFEFTWLKSESVGKLINYLDEILNENK